MRAAAAGATRLWRKLAEAVDLAKLHGEAEVEQALASAAQAGRFGEGDLAAILHHHRAGASATAARTSEALTLQRSTAAWRGFGAPAGPISAAAAENEAVSGDLRACEHAPKAIAARQGGPTATELGR